MSDEQYLTLLSDIQRNNKDALVAPYFNDEYGNKIGLSNMFYVKLKDEGDVAILQKTAKDMGCIVISRDDFMPLWFTLSITESSGLNALENAIFFHESGLFSSAEPDLMADIALSNDTYFGQQYYLKNTGQNGGTRGVDINVEPAWAISTGSDVNVAVIDTGVDLEHDDLKLNTHSLSFDAESGTSPQQIRDSHGTAVAGIVGAVKDNGKVIAGVAPNSKIMSISHSLYTSTNVRQQLAAGINWAHASGAHVINCSWGHPTALSGPYITDAINLAVNQGRSVNGVAKGCVVVAASGNGRPFQNVAYPASLPNVIAVGAVDKFGRVWDYSFRGSALDVVAPSGDTDLIGDIYTLDRMGTNGYETGNYTWRFGGTSAAAPQVAGIAALMLSAYPTLTSSQVDQFIKNTASNTTWYNQTGYGLVNAYRALLEPLLPSGNSQAALNTWVPYSAPANLPTGVSFVNWTSTQNSGITINNPGNWNTTVRFTSYGTYTLTANYTLPGNQPYAASITVRVIDPFAKPSISWDKYVVYPGDILTCTVTNPHPDVVYDWELDGMSNWAVGVGPSQLFNHYYLNSNSGSSTIRCRARIGSQVSAWSNPIVVYVSATPYRAPKPNVDEEEETDDAPPTELQES